MVVGVTGVGVTDGVMVSVIVDVVVGSTIISPSCNAKKTSPAPIAKKIANRMIAKGRLMVICGIRLPRTAFPWTSADIPLVNSEPHTKQRVASSLTLVPHVGHSFVFFGEVSVIF